MSVDPNIVGSWVGTAIFASFAVFERMRSARHSRHAVEVEKKQGAHDEVLAAKEELIGIARKTALAWQERYEAEHAEAMAYRKEQHDRNEKINFKILSQADELAELRTKTDMTPVIKFHESQDKINERIVASLDRQDEINTKVTKSLTENAEINRKVVEAITGLLTDKAQRDREKAR